MTSGRTGPILMSGMLAPISGAAVELGAAGHG